VLYDFHTHTFHSDGVLSPVELIHRAFIQGYTAIGITDHVATGSLKRIIEEVGEDCQLARKNWNIIAIPGVELTHLPPPAISDTAQKARELGAWIVIVHGETTAEPVPAGTNLAAVRSPFVDILAHPGLVTPDVIEIARENNVFLELSSRRGHSATNPHVASASSNTGVRLLVNSDAHTEDDLLSKDRTVEILDQAGVAPDRHLLILEQNPLLLLEKISRSHPSIKSIG
jgi:putative hydrolase